MSYIKTHPRIKAPKIHPTEEFFRDVMIGQIWVLAMREDAGKKKMKKPLKLIHRDISSAYFFLIVDLRERGTRFVLTLFTRHYFTGQIILKIILTIQYMEIYYSLANINVNCIGFYWYKFNKLRKCYEMLKNILYFLGLTFFQSVFLLQKGTSFS